MSQPDSVPAVLERYVAAHNHGVSSGDFRQLGELFSEDAVVEFRGLSIGPFRGRQEIVAAFDRQPPDDQLVLASALPAGGASAEYGWRREPGRPAGTLTVELTGGLVSHLVITVRR